MPSQWEVLGPWYVSTENWVKPYGDIHGPRAATRTSPMITASEAAPTGVLTMFHIVWTIGLRAGVANC